MFNRIVEAREELHKHELKQGEITYVILSDNDSASFARKIKISQGNRSSRTSLRRKDTPIKITVPLSTSPNDTSDTTTTNSMAIDNNSANEDYQNNSSSELKNLNEIKGMTKFDSPVALSFFLEKREQERLKKRLKAPKEEKRNMEK